LKWFRWNSLHTDPRLHEIILQRFDLRNNLFGFLHKIPMRPVKQYIDPWFNSWSAEISSKTALCRFSARNGARENPIADFES
jgi:hypothetical protein